MMTALIDLNGYQTQRGLSNADLLAIADVNSDGLVDNRDLQAVIGLLANAAAAAGGGGGSGSLESVTTNSQPVTATVASVTAAIEHGIAGVFVSSNSDDRIQPQFLA